MRHTRLRVRNLLACGGALLGLAACGGVLLGLTACGGAPAAFATKYPDNRDTDIEQLLQRIDAAPARPVGTIAVGLSPAPQQLFAYDLASRSLLWQRRVDADSAPYPAGDTVVVQSGDHVAGFDLRSGEPRFRIERGKLSLRGADGEGRLTAIALSDGLGTFADSEVVLVQGGSVQWRRAVDKAVGAPAVVGTMVLVPWSNQFLSALDAGSGEEFARVRVRDGVIAHALRDQDEVYVGSYHGIARVTSSIAAGTLKGSGFFALPPQELPGRALLLPDVYTQSGPVASEGAQHRIALAWRPTAPDHARVGLQDGNLYLVFYRFVFALDPASYELRWVYVHDADIVGAAAQVNGVALADEGGHFAFLGAASGEPLWKAASRMPSSVVRLPRGGSGADSPGTPLPASELPARLLAAALDQDARLVPARLMAVDALARLPQPDATANLIELCDTARSAPPVRERACAKLKDRAIGADHLLAALERHAGYLEGTTAPPVGALAKAAASLKETRAVPLLIAHLKDPNTRSSDLPALVAALGQLGDSAAGEPLADFFQLYHADAIDEHMVAALEAVPAALLALSGPVAKPVLEAVTYDELGAYSVRQRTRAALDTLLAQQQAAEKSDEEEQVEQEQQAAAESEQSKDPQFLPTHLDFELISAALLPVRDQLRACLRGASRPTYQARMLLAIEQGQAMMVSVLPAELQPCVEPLVRAQKFPQTRTGKREQVTFPIKR